MPESVQHDLPEQPKKKPEKKSGILRNVPLVIAAAIGGGIGAAAVLKNCNCDGVTGEPISLGESRDGAVATPPPTPAAVDAGVATDSSIPAAVAGDSGVAFDGAAAADAAPSKGKKPAQEKPAQATDKSMNVEFSNLPERQEFPCIVSVRSRHAMEPQTNPDQLAIDLSTFTVTVEQTNTDTKEAHVILRRGVPGQDNGVEYRTERPVRYLTNGDLGIGGVVKSFQQCGLKRRYPPIPNSADSPEEFYVKLSVTDEGTYYTAVIDPTGPQPPLDTHCATYTNQNRAATGHSAGATFMCWDAKRRNVRAAPLDTALRAAREYKLIKAERGK